MIIDAEATTILSSLGWVDGDSIWQFDLASGQHTTLSLDSGARYASLHAAGSTLFAVAHHFDGRRFEVTVRAFANPDAVLARAVIAEAFAEVTGDLAVWAAVPSLYVGYLSFLPYGGYVLIRVSGSGEIHIQRLAWFDGSYDKGYQGVVAALQVPGTDCAVISVQRSSQLILHDLKTGRKMMSIALVDRGGGEAITFSTDGRELWARDYDTVVVLSTVDWRVLRSSCLQGAPAGVRQFIGEVAFTPDADECLVARPFSGDVVSIDPVTLRIEGRARVGRQPPEAIIVPSGDVVARDWKTGHVLRGHLKRRWFAG